MRAADRSGSELRRDPILRQWVIIAAERAGSPVPRPAPAAESYPEHDCPFCPGHEDTNPIEIVRSPASGPWAVRVTPDRHPLLRIEGDIERRPVGMFDFMNAVGAHELVVDSAEHASTWADFSPAHLARLLGVYRDRSRDLRRDGRFRYVLVLMNRGASWSRYTHPHSHVVATPFTPKRVEEEIAGARVYHRQKERCAFCDLIAEERHAGLRIVAEQPGFVALTPFASGHAYETWILPSRHEADFGQLPDEGLAPLATLLLETLGCLRRALHDPPYRIALHAGGVDGSDAEAYHWHWEIVPLLGHELGMEWATGIVSNPVPPEAAAERLRNAAATP